MLPIIICAIGIIYCLLALDKQKNKAEQEAKLYKEENERLKAEIESLKNRQ